MYDKKFMTIMHLIGRNIIIYFSSCGACIVEIYIRSIYCESKTVSIKNTDHNGSQYLYRHSLVSGSM